MPSSRVGWGRNSPIRLIWRFPRSPRLRDNFRYIAARAWSLFVNLETPPEFTAPPSYRCRADAGPGLALFLAAALALAGCGRAGPLEPPPDPNAVAKPADSDPTHVQVHHKPPPIKPPNAPFVLDPLL